MDKQNKQKITKEIQEAVKERDLVKDELQQLKTYNMIEGDYKVMITVLEASELISKNDDYFLFKAEKTACDAFVQIETMGITKRTQVRKQTNNPIFDSKFNFFFKGLRVNDLQNASLNVRVIDRKSLLIRDAIIGQNSFDWTSVYFSRNHQFYRSWIALTDPMDENQGITGYVLMTIAILGPNDKQTIHDSSYIKNPLTTMEAIVIDKKTILTPYVLEVNIYQAQQLTPYNMIDFSIQSYVVVKFCGSKQATRVKKSKNPVWNQKVTISTQIPNKSKYAFLQLWNYNKLSRDQLIGIVTIDFADLYKASLPPQYKYIYGPPMKGKDSLKPYATDMVLYGQKQGSHYHGRLLISASCYSDSNPKTKSELMRFQFPFVPAPIISQKNYVIQVDVIEGFQVPSGFMEYQIHLMIGPYLLKTRKINATFGNCKWFQTLPQKRVVLPVEAEQLPAVFIYLAKGQNQQDRISFKRINARQMLIRPDSKSKQRKQNIYMLNEDKTLNQVKFSQSGGFIRMRMGIFDVTPPKLQPLKIDQIKPGKYQLRIHVLIGRGLQSKNQTGTSDAFLDLRCSGQKSTTQPKQNTLNPNWFETVIMNVQLQDKESSFQKVIMAYMFDYEQKGEHNFMGKTWIPIRWQKKNLKRFRSGKRQTKILFEKARWFNILDDQNDKKGKVMLSFTLIPKEDASIVPVPKSLMPEGEQRKIQIFVLGLRHVQEQINGMVLKRLKLKFRFQQRGQEQREIILEEDKIKNRATTPMKLLQKTIYVYKNKNFAPLMELLLYQASGKSEQMVGYQYVNLFNLIPKLKYFPANKGDMDAPQMQNIPELSNQDTIPDVQQIKLQMNNLQKERLAQQQIQQKTKINPIYNPKLFNKAKLNSKKEEDQQNLDDIPYEFQHDPNKIDHQEIRKYDHESASKYSSIGDVNLEKIVQEIDLSDNQVFLEKDNQAAAIERRRDQEVSIFQDVNQNMLSKKADRQVIQIDQNDQSKRLIQPKRQLQNENKRKSQKLLSIKNKLRQRKKQASELDINCDFEPKYGKNEHTQSIHMSDIQNIQESLIKSQEQERNAVNFQNIKKYRDAEQKMENEARLIQEQKKIGLQKLSLYFAKKRKRDQQTYEQYDTDPQEDLNLVPEWYRERKTISYDFEEKFFVKKLKTLPIYSGKDSRVLHTVGLLKCIFLSYDSPDRAKEKCQEYKKLLRPKSYVVRIYILKGKSLISQEKEKPSTYLKIGINGDVTDLKDKTLRVDDSNPAYYISHDIQIKLPGPNFLRIDVYQKSLSIFNDQLLGYTELDLQNRYLTKKWYYFDQKPIELRNLYNPYGTGCQGRLQTWIQLIQIKAWKHNPAIKIEPPPYDPYQLRVIVWETFTDTLEDSGQLADIFVRGHIGTQDPLQTDTHWRCKGKGSFNWRWKFKVNYPPKPEQNYTDQLVLQMWDLNVAGHNKLIGQTRININGVHRIIQKSCKRKKTVEGKVKIKEKAGEITSKIWFNVYHPTKKDEFGKRLPQGKIRVGFQLIPEEQAKKKENGLGRSEPNIYPILPQPEGRLSFDLLHPLQFIKSLIGAAAYERFCCKICCLLVIILCLMFGYVIFGSVIGSLLTK